MTVIIIAAAAAALFALGLFAAECVWLRREMLPAPAPDLTRGGLEKTRFARYAGTIVPDVLELRALPWEDVYMSSFDGLRLHARLVRGGDDAVVLMHGFRSSIEDDFAGIAQWYVRRGFTVIAADERAHGLSEGKYLTFGTKEQYDAVAWAQYAEFELGSARVWMHGASMGAASVIFALRDGYPDAVRGVIVDCPFDSIRGLFDYVIARKSRLPAFLAQNMAAAARALILGPGPAKMSCHAAVAAGSLPVLIFEGGGDHTVPPGCAGSIRAAGGGRCEVVTIPEAKHTLCWQEDRETCAAALERFIDENRGR